MQFPEARILIFAKEPIPGEVKTRLVPALGNEQAADLYRRLLESKVSQMTRAALCPVECWCAPTGKRPFFSKLAASGQVALFDQQGRDLGERMAAAARQTLSRSCTPILIGADCPPLDETHVRGALDWLKEGVDVVIGPAEDGGYVLLGLRRYHDRLFEDVPWGTGEVLAQTRERCRELGWTSRELPPLWDVDRPEDLRRLAAFEPQYSRFLKTGEKR